MLIFFGNGEDIALLMPPSSKKPMAPRARFELARDCSHGLSRPALYQAKRDRRNFVTLKGGFRIKLGHRLITRPFA